ncbi:divisome protein SepX/GlpR [Nocardiopsis kunsanensis]|uniref:Uncharacterized protein n=1 Tax=Nocardiopsis kunsanensis TaxID=141693 RepID=A0A918XGI4_9ACTN|nr:hypothetical protein [Nocardiopsis kunsanensis]GHD30961.1 hypothetical protein GCM10007147_33290 [Nocardiopsis kunsanensis]
MSSSPLYLAIVVVWLIVLVPMLLRKDSIAESAAEETRREGDEVEEDLEQERTDEQNPDAAETQVLRRGEHGIPEPAGEEPEMPEPFRESRARVIARRRRRTSTLVLVNVATIIAVSLGLGPWWVLAPPVLLLAGHVLLLREAAKADAEQRAAARRARRRAALRARREAEERRREAEREAEVIALKARRSNVYDQYADARMRAAGD